MTLKYVESIHPSKVHPRADHWKNIFKLYRDENPIDNGLFTDHYYLSSKRKTLILEEYGLSIDDMKRIQFDEDIILNLRLFDFNNQRTGRFSKITGGGFSIKDIKENKVIFQKVYYDKTIEYETTLGDIDMDKIGD